MILDAQGRPVHVEPIPVRPPESAWERREREAGAKWLEFLAETTPKVVFR